MEREMGEMEETKNQINYDDEFTRVRKPLITWSHG
jgi:hypothetical protein